MGGPKEHKRLQKELKELAVADPELSVTAKMVGDDLTRWRGSVKGPGGTPYEGGKFILNIQIPPQYPYSAPKIQFETRIWHPNISSQTGAICLDILKTEWSPALTIRTALLSIQSLLSSPEPDDPQDAEVANMFKQNHAMFDQTARAWTRMFAKDEPESEEDKIKKLTDMGFGRDQAKDALSSRAWDETAALNFLLGEG